MHETDCTQDSTGLLQRKCMWKKVKGKYDASPAHIAPSKSSTSSGNDTKEEKDFLCSSCACKFSCQQALAGHRNIHRGEWESLLDIPDHGKADQCCELPNKTQTCLVSNPITALKWQSSSRNTTSMQRDASSTIHKPLLCKPKNTLTFTCVHQSPLVKPTNTLKGPHLYHLATSTNTLKGPLPWHSLASPINILKGPSPRCHLANPKESSTPNPLANRPTNTFKGSPVFRPPNLLTNTFLRPSLIAPQRPFFGSRKTPHMPSIQDPNHPLDNCAKPHGKLALGVRYESMIHKPCRCRRVGPSDMLLRTSSLSFGTKQMMRGNIRSEGGFSSKTHDLISSSFQPRGGKGIEANDHNGDQEVDLDLKL
ncbi:hypothetical protein L1987_72135 [Smallanthus sonchifolius]|uniref:Uncharacterized protein n=1 Tax=Smallanthus sonchifolius TaxID=185202 RepID=A0ACB9AUE3_9ASTR|nr:hypothetical protein L1987_72135 [Smallanthus sonchifolius]